MDDSDDLSDLNLPADDVIGVWDDLASALAGKNGYGGDVAEIYAYRLLPSPLRQQHTAEEAEKQAPIVGVNMTRLLRHFLERHDAVVAIEEGPDEFRPLDLDTEECPPFSWRVHLRVSQIASQTPAPPVHELRTILAETIESATVMSAMLDELAQLRAKDRLRADTSPPAVTDDLPPDAATGLYLDRSFDAGDLEWIKMAWDAYLNDSSPARPAQIMGVFQAIQRDERATAEFLRVMNTIMLPLCRRLRLQRQPHLTKIGAAGE